MEVPEGILYMDYNMPLACYPWSLLIYYLLNIYTLSIQETISGNGMERNGIKQRNIYKLEVE
jgi:hypothetical protein